MIVGCGKTETEIVSGKTDKPLNPEEKIVGTYEIKTIRMVFKENRKVNILNLKPETIPDEWNWKVIVNNVHIEKSYSPLFGETSILKIEPNGDLTEIGWIIDGKQTTFPKEDQDTWKKIK